MNSEATGSWLCDFSYASSLRLNLFIFKWKNNTSCHRLLEKVNEITQDGLLLLDYVQRAAGRRKGGKEGNGLLLVHCPRNSTEETDHPNNC